MAILNKFSSSRLLLISLLGVLLPVTVAMAQSPHTHNHSFGNAQKWAQVFDGPQRVAEAA